MAGDPQVEEVRARTDILEVVGNYVRLRRSGKSFQGLCPFHNEKSPSFYVNPDLKTFRCFGCGKFGDVFTFLQEIEHITFVEALERLAERVGVRLVKRSPEAKGEADAMRAALDAAQAFFREQLLRSQSAQEFVRARGIPDGLAERFGLGFAPGFGDALATTLQKQGHRLADAAKAGLVDQGPDGGYYDKFRGRLMFPVFDPQGRIIAFGGRVLGVGEPKYLNSPDTPLFSKRNVLYAFHLAKSNIAERGFALIVEGYLDVIACHGAGLEYAVAGLGTAFGEEHASLLKRWTEKLVVMFDADEAGRKAALRAAQIAVAAGLRTRIARLPDGEDPDSLLKKQGTGALSAVVARASTPTDFELDLLEARHDLSSSEGAAEFVAAAVRVLAAIPSQVERDRYIERVARHLPSFLTDRVRAERLVHQEVAALARGKAVVRTETRPSALRTRSAVEKAQRGLLRAACDPEWRGLGWPALRPEQFPSPEYREIVHALLAAYPDMPPQGSAAEVLASVSPAETQRALHDILITDSEPLGEQILKDYLQCLTVALQKASRRRLQADISDATTKTDAVWQEYCRLLGEQSRGD
ncbi:MAG: DNA primase [Fimbriimonadia bacterium]|jgi:DNA primase